MFGAGTAAIVSPIKRVKFVTKKDKDGKITEFVDINVPLDPDNPSSQAGRLAKTFTDKIMGIQYGEIPHEWSVVVK